MHYLFHLLVPFGTKMLNTKIFYVQHANFWYNRTNIVFIAWIDFKLKHKIVLTSARYTLLLVS